MGVKLDNFKAIMWKNCIIRKTHWFITILELLAPCTAVWMLLHARLNYDLSYHNVTKSEPYSLDHCFHKKLSSGKVILSYTPSNEYTNKIMNMTKERISLKQNGSQPELKPMKTEVEIEHFFKTICFENGTYFYGIVFERIGTIFQYKIRMGGNNTNFYTDKRYPDIIYNGSNSLEPFYNDTCFLTLQKTLDILYIESVSFTYNKSRVIPKILMMEFPYPEFIRNNILVDSKLVIPLTILFGWCILFPMLIKWVVEEKHTGAKEFMKIMGLREWIFWAGWLLYAYMVMIFVITISTIFLTKKFSKDIPPLIPHTNPILVWLLLFLFTNAITFYLFIVCGFFHRATKAICVAMSLYFIPTFIFLIPYVKMHLNTEKKKLLACLMPTHAMFEGFRIIISFIQKHIDDTGTGVQWTTLFTRVKVGDLSFGLVLSMLILDTIIFGFISWYFDKIRPGPYGRAKPWYFVIPLLCFQCKKQRDNEFEDEDDNVRTNPKYFEKPPQHFNVGLSIRNLTKRFRRKINSVDDVNIDIYEGQITILLGCNGSGKTTTLSIITGLISPTSGNVYLHMTGTDKTINIFKHMNMYRQQLGLCPQNKMLLPYFTTKQHLIFFGMLRGMSWAGAKEEGFELLRSLKIIRKEKVKVHNLSEGMKRKLALAIAMIDSPRILILDEPSSGADAESRQEIWDLLLSNRKCRIIIVTTQDMEEANVLGGRVAIMNHGKLQCYGSPMFLKNAYGTGYNMTLLTSPDANERKITKIVRNTVPGSNLRSQYPGKLVYNLPSKYFNNFSTLFAKIENKKSSLLVTSIGVSGTTIEDVFLKVAEVSESEQNDSAPSSEVSLSDSISSTKVSGVKLFCMQIGLLLLKKIRFTYRRICCCRFLAIIATVLIGVAIASFKIKKETFQPINLLIDVDELYQGKYIIVTYVNQLRVVEYIILYRSLMTSPVLIFLADKNVTSALMNISRYDIEFYAFDVVVAANWTPHVVTGLYSRIAIHSAPISLNLITNSILKWHQPNNSIVISNHPFTEQTYSRCTFDKLEIVQFLLAFIWAVLIPLGLLFLVANFIVFPVHERVMGFKHLQFMAGVSPIIYWLTSFICDYTLFIFTAPLLIIPVIVFDQFHMFSKTRVVIAFLIIIYTYGLGAIAFVYFFSFLRKSSTSAYAHFIFYNMLFLLIFTIILFILVSLMQLNKKKSKILKVVNYICMLNPYYCILMAVFRFIKHLFKKSSCEFCMAEYKNDSVMAEQINDVLKCDLDTPTFAIETNIDQYGVGFHLIFMLSDMLLYIIIVLLLDYRLLAILCNCLKKICIRKDNDRNLDSDVQNEQTNVDGALIGINKGSSFLLISPKLMVDNLKKTYGCKLHIVRGISFTVNSGECFGLLGVNGAGKTTTYKMLAGQQIPTKGDVIISKLGLKSDRRKYLKQIGYCPQVGGLNYIMTGRELIYLFGRFRGLNSTDCRHATNYWLKYLGLEKCGNRLCGTYCRSEKRKLNIAIALIGNPVILFLDDPSGSIDPVARYNLWKALANCQNNGQSIVLTSYRMDECEILCNKMTVMINGELVCFGNVVYLKKKFGKGYTLTIKLQPAEDDKLKSLKKDIRKAFPPQLILITEQPGWLHYYIPDNTGTRTLSTVFNAIEGIKRKHGSLIEDYLLSDTTLDQIFISIANQNKQYKC